MCGRGQLPTYIHRAVQQNHERSGPDIDRPHVHSSFYATLWPHRKQSKQSQLQAFTSSNECQTVNDVRPERILFCNAVCHAHP